MNFKILGEVLGSHTGGVYHLSPCISLIWTLKFYVKYWVVHGGKSSFSMCRLNLKFKILGEILGSHTWEGSVIFHHVQAIYELSNFRWDTVWSCRGQSSFTMSCLNLNFINFRWDTVWSCGGQSSFTKYRLNLNFKIWGEILVSHTGGQSSFTMSCLNLNFINFRWDTVWSCGSQSPFTKCRLNLNFKIWGEILVSHTGGQSSFTMCRLNLNIKILGEILGSPGGSIIFQHVQAKSEL